MLNQNLQQQMRQKLSPQQIMLMKLMQVPVMLLEQRIKEEIENNPALDISDENSDNQEDKNDDFETPEQEKDDKNEEPEHESEPENEFSLEDYLDEDDIPDYRLYSNNRSADDEDKELPMVSNKSFHESLVDQLRLRDLDETDMQIALQIIGSIDDSGYLSRDAEIIADDLAVMKNIQTSGKHVIEILQIIQDFDPAGIGARNLQECLQLQLKRKTPTQAVKHATIVINKYFSEFSKKHYDRIMKRTEMTEEQLKNAIAEILKLNPKPGDFSADIYLINQSIIPDFILHVIGDTLDIQLNNSHIPELHISRDYQDMLEHYSKSDNKNSQNKEAIQFVRSRIDAARWFIDAIRQRKNTLMSVMNAIATAQKEYFISGDEKHIKPMILNDIAQKLSMDVSTISRVVSSKYVQTPYGTLLLKNLFSESFQNEDGDEVSTKEIKQAVKKLIEEEDKSAPLTDDKLLKLLKKEGYGIARRTVAKYREQLGIAPSRMRKEL
jgi:RNA polymerase sigma-54 factor